MGSYLVAVVVVAAASAAWLAVQRRWRREFADCVRETDSLAARGSCGSCTVSKCEFRNEDKS